MFNTVVFGVGGLFCVTLGVWFIVRQHRRGASTRAAWGATVLGFGQFFRAADSFTESHQLLGLILVVCYLAFSLGGFFLLWRDRGMFHRGGRKRRKLPPLEP